MQEMNVLMLIFKFCPYSRLLKNGGVVNVSLA